jgi:Fe-S cluster biogenesis protein NfuA
MNEHQTAITEVVSAMNELVAKDGGAIDVIGFGDGQLDVNYKVGVNDECATCLITPEILHDFILEGLRARDVPVDDVRVESA